MRMLVATCYFNPCKYKRIVRNYTAFRHLMDSHDIEVVTAELVLDDDIPQVGDAIYYRGSRATHWMWQKEALLNQVIKARSKGYDVTAWVDADIIFTYPYWVDDTLRELDRVPITQMFSDAHWTDSQGSIVTRVKSTAHWWTIGDKRWDDFTQSHPGFAWAARSDLLLMHGLYDKIITGCGDTVMLRGWTGEAMASTMRYFGPAVYRDVNRWAEPIDTEIGCVPGSVVHMYHGDLRHRDNRGRRTLLANFDPETDVERDENGLLIWSKYAHEAKPELITSVKDYFFARREDD
jgi:hypothetical protein